jgi:hypothetical protein
LMKCSAPCPISDPQWIWSFSSSYSEDKCAPVRVEPGLKVTWTEWPLQNISDAVSFFHARLIGFSFLSSLASPWVSAATGVSFASSGSATIFFVW